MDTATNLSETVPAISRDELDRRLGERDLVLLNVLAKEFFESLRIKGSRSLPVIDIAARAAEVIPDPDQEIVVYCGSFT